MAGKPETRRTVVLTDHPWPDLVIEETIFSQAGIELIAGPIDAPAAGLVDQMIFDADPDAIMTCWAQVSANAISAPKHLAIVARLGIGLDNIDVASATARGAWVTNVPDYCVEEVADHAMAFVLAAMRGVVEFDRAAKQGQWSPSSARLRRISELTVGLIGYGRIGRATGQRLQPFGCRVLATSRSLKQAEPGVEAVDLATIQSACDIIILHAPLTDETRNLIDDEFLRGCARKPLIVNVTRGGLIDNDALLRALDAGLVCGAALDVIEGEPSPPPAMLAHPRITVTPHIAFSSESSLVELRRRACEEVVRVLSGEPPHCPCNEPGTALDGGVASDIRMVDGPGGKEVVKRALSKLRVRADWFADPARSDTEVAALKIAGELLGNGAVPEVLWSKPDSNTFAMRYVGPPFENWKGRLLAGTVEAPVAREAAALLAKLHRQSMGRADIEQRFADTTNFDELRVDPFFRRTAPLCPDVADAILQAGEAMSARKVALVHGDYSPKNLLTDGRDVVILDWEVAHWGDPRFDVAFCISHLLLKAYRRKADRAAVLASADAFSTVYREGNPGFWDADLLGLIGALLLNRIIGTSPVDYLDELEIEAVRDLAKGLLQATPDARAIPFLSRLEPLNVSQIA